MKSLFFTTIIFLLVSCTWSDKEWVIENTVNTIDWYSDTLEWSVKDAKEVKSLLEQNNIKLENEIRSK